MNTGYRFSGSLLVAAALSFATAADAAERFVAPGGTGKGSSSAPFGRIQDALNASQPGDVISIAKGTYKESLRTVRHGTSTGRITLRARDGARSVVVTAAGRVLTVSHSYLTVDGIVLDGQYGAADLLKVESAGHGFTLRNAEVRRTSRDAIDMGAPRDVLIENSLIHRSLNAAGGRTDAHGIVAGAVRRLTIRNTEVHTFSGDAFQVDPGRSAAGWSDVIVDGCRFWLAPLSAPENGFSAGTVPGENAIDTKAAASAPRAKLTVRNTEARGFRNGLIGNMAAFNLKENIDALIDGVTVWGSEIAFRMRGPGPNGGAVVRVQNAVVHTSAVGFRYEDDIVSPRLYNVTIGSGVARPFVNASSSGTDLDVRNFLMLGTTLPGQAAGSSNRVVPASAFVDAARHNYQLRAGTTPVDAGVTISGVTRDRQGTSRPQGASYDIGAYERAVSATTLSALASDGEIVLHAWKANMLAGNWSLVADPTAAGGFRVASAHEGQRFETASAAPMDYVELTFHAEGGKPYRLWMRGRAEQDRANADSVYAQFSGSVDQNGSPIYRIGSSSAATISLRECNRCPLSGWGWQDTATGMDKLGPPIYFATTGVQTIRIQTREDGMAIDQIVLSPSTYLSARPGSASNDNTILPESGH